MTSALRSPLVRTPPATAATSLGDAVASVARTYAARMNASAFAVALRSGRLAQADYLAFVTLMYPAVVGFNRALIRSIAKVDHVRNSPFVRSLAKQLEEEQAHNQLWRAKLDAFGIDHEAVYADLETYLARFSRAELDAMTAAVIARVTVELSHGDGGVFPDAPFPDAILALYHQLWMSASDDNIGYWEHFASQASIEMIIFDVVSSSILPGVSGNPEFDLGPVTTAWWREHGELPGQENEFSEEKRHLELSRIALDRSDEAATMRGRVLARAEDAMRLFAASLLCQPLAAGEFRVDRYRQ
jgi:hypothetical protein